jgi:hypothetical protein
MHHRVPRLHGAFFRFRTLFSEELIALLLVLFVFVVPAGATTRFENRSLLMMSTQPSVTTTYQLSLDYMSPEPVGSLDMLFCESPIPYDPCVKPAGLNISQASLVSQTGEVGFSAQVLSDTHIILSRTPSMIVGTGSKSTYTFSNIVNPSSQTTSFSIRLKSHASTNATGPLIDFGSVKGQVGDGITIETQVPPMLIFCAAEEVADDCSETNGNYFTDMGNLSKDATLTAQSQFGVGTNATGGFAITVTGNPLTAGTNVIDAMQSPAESRAGRNQFGINLVENSDLGVGQNPEGDWANAVPTAAYNQPNRYTYIQGDVIAASPNVSLMKKFTVSYIVNVSPSLRAGVYTTTLNYIASGRF